jgi:uncharacterized protein YndB with AHSA1/START domain
VTYDSLSLSEMIPALPERIYAAWLSSAEHSAFTGDKAIVEPFVGGKHSSFDGYAVGQTVDLQPGRRIVQTWRAEDFPIGSPDSRVEVTLEETVGGTMVTILHTEIPSGQGSSYRDAWLKYYLEPLRVYFVNVSPKSNGVPKQAPQIAARPAPKQATAKKKTANEKLAKVKTPAPKKTAAKKKTAKKTAAAKASKQAMKKAVVKASKPKARAKKKTAKSARKRAARKR